MRTKRKSTEKEFGIILQKTKNIHLLETKIVAIQKKIFLLMILLNFIFKTHCTFSIVHVIFVLIRSARGNQRASRLHAMNEAMRRDVRRSAQDRHRDHSNEKSVPLVVVDLEPVFCLLVLLRTHRRRGDFVPEVDSVEGEEGSVAEAAGAGCC